MNMVEKVARAIYDATEPKMSWDLTPDAYKADYIGYARAAIQAMREATPAMSRIAEDAEIFALPQGVETHDHYAIVYRHMIDKALTE